METHQVINQSPVLENINLFEIDSPLKQMLATHLADEEMAKAKMYGEHMGSSSWIKKGALANAYSPVFHSHDIKGFRTDEVEFHPAYHEIMQKGIGNNIHSLPWKEKQKGSHLLRMALFYLHGQNEAGTCCPITMTFSSFPALLNHLPQAEEWVPKILSAQYDPANKPYFQKKGLTIGMAMTEKQGGTDVKANTTSAKPLGKQEPGELYELTGHKWFCSAPMSDAFLTLAQTGKGLSCFLLPRWQPDGTRNNFRIQRLKDKLGNRSNASSEMEFDGATAWLMGEEGRGVSVILEMVSLTRYDCMIGSTALMRRGLTEVLHHIQYRKVYGKRLVDQPLMQNVVADLCLEWEAALALTYRATLCLEHSEKEEEQLLLRLITPLGKYWITKRSIAFLGEAMECLGGNGYVEDTVLPRLYREAPVNAIWEGSGNVQCLDILRAIGKSPKVLDVLMIELESAKGHNPLYDNYISKLDFSESVFREENARQLAEQFVKAIQAAQLIKLGNETVSGAYCKSRLDHYSGYQFGMLPDSVPYKAIIEENLFSHKA